MLVIGLIGERGRELHDFLEHTLGAEGRARSVVVVATSDKPAMLRRRAAYLTLTIAEFLRDQGLKVLCLMDSVTRFAMALREIYLAAGEVPTSRGYPPGVFAELPRLLERAGPGEGDGSITGLFTVLVEGDDTNEPVSDAVRGILDGHIVLDRADRRARPLPRRRCPAQHLAHAPGCYAPDERELVREARRLLRLHADMAELIRLGAYRAGSNAELDRAIAVHPALERLLEQDAGERSTRDAAFAALAAGLADGARAGALMRCAARRSCWRGWSGMRWTSSGWRCRRSRASWSGCAQEIGRRRAAAGARARHGLGAAGRAAPAGGLSQAAEAARHERCAQPSTHARAGGRRSAGRAAGAAAQLQGSGARRARAGGARPLRPSMQAAAEVEEAARAAAARLIRTPAPASTSSPSSAGPNLIWQDSRELSRTSNASSSIMLSSELAALQPRQPGLVDIDMAGGAGAAAAAGGLDRQVVLADDLHDGPADRSRRARAEHLRGR